MLRRNSQQSNISRFTSMTSDVGLEIKVKVGLKYSICGDLFMRSIIEHKQLCIECLWLLYNLMSSIIAMSKWVY